MKQENPGRFRRRYRRQNGRARRGGPCRFIRGAETRGRFPFPANPFPSASGVRGGQTSWSQV